MTAPDSIYTGRASELCVFRERFLSPSQVARNGWTLVGSPPLVPGGGVSLDGTTQYIHRPVVHEFNSPEITIVMEFTPDFNWDDDQYRYFFDSAVPGNSLVYKADNAANNIIRLYLNGTLIATVTSATYSPYWKQEQRNQLVISSKSGDTSIWFNGISVLSNSPTVWSPTQSATLYVGAKRDGTLKVDGIIHEFHIFNEAWDAVQEANWRHNRTFSALGQADCILPMRAQHGTGVVGDEMRTPDRSGKGRDFQLGNGVTAAKIPTFQNPGFLFTGTEYIYRGSGDIFGSTEQTLVLCLTPNDPWDLSGYIHWLDTTAFSYAIIKRNAANAHKLLVVAGGGSILLDIAATNWVPHWRWKGKNVLVVSITSGNNRAWINGVLIGNTANLWNPTTPAFTVLGISNNFVVNPFRGTFHAFYSFPFLFSAVQAREITARLLRGVA